MYLVTCAVLALAGWNDAALERTVAGQTAPVWVTKLLSLEKAVQRIPPSVRYKIETKIPSEIEISLAYQGRLQQVQQALHKNPVLRTYTFLTPKAQDFVQLNSLRFETLLLFLQAPINRAVLPQQTPQAVGTPLPFVLALQLGTTYQEALEIWLDVPHKRIYLMSDNLLTSAQAKYATPLF